jgi:hypothetical protein
MRGPREVDDILRELHQEVFPGGRPHHTPGSGVDASARVEVLSAGGDSAAPSELNDETGSLLDAAAGAAPKPKPRKAAQGTRAPRKARV